MRVQSRRGSTEDEKNPLEDSLPDSSIPRARAPGFKLREPNEQCFIIKHNGLYNENWLRLPPRILFIPLTVKDRGQPIQREGTGILSLLAVRSAKMMDEYS
jgi:hypothetical protein